MRTPLFPRFVVALSLVLFVSCVEARAENNDSALPVTILGSDATGVVVPHARIEIAPSQERTQNSMETGHDGRLRVRLTPGWYQLTVMRSGFERWSKRVPVQWAPNQVVEARLEIARTRVYPVIQFSPGPIYVSPLETFPNALALRSAISDFRLLAEPPPATIFDGETWWAHVKFLADDKLEGRDTGSRGERTAQKYAVKQLKKAGALPAGVDGFYQPVKFVSRQIVEKDSSLTLIRDGKREPLVLGEDAIIGTRVMPAPEMTAPLVFAGYGLKVPEKNYDDFAGLDLRGKIAVIFGGSPSEIPGPLASHYQTIAERWKALRATGAVGVVTLPNPASMDVPWSRIALNRTHPSMELDYPEFNETEGDNLAVTVNPASADKFFAGSGHSFGEIAALGKERKALPHFPLTVSLEVNARVELTKVESANIVAKIPGSDPALKDEYVVLSAHLDHIGIGEPINGDRIYNGAMDNGSGSALVLDMAASFKHLSDAHRVDAHREKLRRSILLVLVTGEEKGLLGSKYFAAHPTVAGKSMVADINVDMFLPIVPLKVLTVQGLEESDLGDRARAIAQSMGVKVQADPEPQRNVFIRSDQYNFIRHGVPSVMMDVGAEPGSAEQKIFKEWRTQRYHAPSDDVNQPVDLEAAAKYEEIVRALLVNVADEDMTPRWKPESFFRRYEQSGLPKQGVNTIPAALGMQ